MDITIQSWIKAFRLRTLPLAISCVCMGAIVAAEYRAFKADVFILCLITTVLLQILSNLANDYGDFMHGADHALRIGPVRTVQSGLIPPQKMRNMIFAFAMLSFVAGFLLLWVSLGADLIRWFVFLSLGVLSIVAAITYTAGRKPYGYVGLGDVAVLFFFGITGVVGSAYLYTGFFRPNMLWPALSCGLLAVGVLNINNLRDRESDALAGKKSIPVRYGHRFGTLYHATLLTGAVLSAAIYVALQYRHPVQGLFLLVIPLFVQNVHAMLTKPAPALDPWLRQLAISTLLFVVLFGTGQLISLQH